VTASSPTRAAGPGPQASAPSPLLRISSLRVLRGTENEVVTAVDGVDLTVLPGETLAIVGESGSGKSTIAGVIAGLLPAATTRIDGQVSFAGLDLTTASEAQWSEIRGRRLSIVFQDQATALNPVAKVGRQVAEAIRIHDRTVGREQAQERVVALFEQVGIPTPRERVHAYPHELSGGMRQRVMIAMAMANSPSLLIADEPTTALDVTIQAQVLDLLKSLQRSTGMAMVFITHNLEVVSGFADRVIVMRKGKVVEAGATASLFASPQHPYTRELLAAIPRIDPKPRRSPSPPVLEVEHLVRSFRGRRRSQRVLAVDDVSLTIGAGRTLGIVGESGSGKTTLARCVAGLIARDEGVVRIDGLATRRRGRDRALRDSAALQFVFQDPFESLDPTWTVEDVVGEPLLRHHLAATERRRRIGEALESVSLDGAVAGRRPREFSGGERQRISIARALVVRPELMVLDEPTASLDVSIQAKVVELLQRVQQEYGLAYLFITHDLALAYNVSDRIAVMRNGRIVETGDADAVFASPRHEYTRTLLAARPTLPGQEISGLQRQEVP
jgi:ABC-type microcin C transport system duplicated ATPase subunit YejF